MFSSVIDLVPAALRLGEPEINLALVIHSGASTLSMRSICLSLLWAWVGLGVLGAEAVDELHQRPISRSWFL